MERAERRRWTSPGDGDGDEMQLGDETGLGLAQEKVTCRLRFKADFSPLTARQERTGGDGNGTTAVAAGGRPLRGGSAA